MNIKKFIKEIEIILFDDWQEIDKSLKKEFYKISTIQLVSSLIDIGSLVFLTIYIAFVLDNNSVAQKIRVLEEIFNIKTEVNSLTIILIGLYILKIIISIEAIKKEIAFVAKYSSIVGRKLIEVLTTNEKYTAGSMDITEKQRIVDLDAIRMILYLRNYSVLIKEVFAMFILIGLATIYDATILMVVSVLMTILYAIYKLVIEATLKKDGIASKIIRVKELQIMFKILELNNLLKIYGVKNKENDNYEEIIQKREVVEGRRRLIAAIPKLSIEMTTVATIAIAVLVTNLYDPENTKEILLTIVGMAIISIRLIPTVNSLSYAVSELAYQSESYIRVKSIFKEDYVENLQLKNKHDETVGIDYRESADLIIRDVSYKYPNSTEFVFEKLNFIVKKGSAVGVFGGSGVGKTTLIDIITGVIKPVKGEILYGERSIHDNYKQWCTKIALVPQSSKFFPGTVYENIVFENDELDTDRLNKVCEMARIKEITKVLENIAPEEIPNSIAQTLSGGQKQRLSIARALYRNSSILILDEATSALDQKTKDEIMSDLTRLKGAVTIIMVTHDEGLKKYFDQVIDLGGANE